MRYNIPVLAAAILVIGGIVWAALHFGPPGGVQTGSPPVAESAAPKAMVVNGFGRVPVCNDQVAIDTVLGMVRDRDPVRITGLADIRDGGPSRVGNTSERACDAEMQTSGGQTRIQYRIATLPAKDSWQISASMPGR